MSLFGFVDEYLDNANKFYRLAMNQYDLFLKLMGVDVIVSRVSDESKYKNVFGTTFSSNLVGDEDVKRFKYRIILNLNDMRKIYQQVNEQFEILDNKNVIKLGDVITFSRKDKEYNFKVIDEQAFSEAKDVLYKYTLIGFQEISTDRY